MVDQIMKVPSEPCPSEGWTILDAMANCCVSWQETVEYAPSGLIEKKWLRGDMATWFAELQMFGTLGTLRGFGRNGGPLAPRQEIPKPAWEEFRLTDARLSKMTSHEGATIYDVRLYLPAPKRGRPDPLPWIRDWCRGKYPTGLPQNDEKLRIIVLQIMDDFAASKQREIISGYNSMELAQSTALEWLKILAEDGYDTRRRRRQSKPAK